MAKETIEEKVTRLLKGVQASGVPDEITVFTLLEKVTELAIAEEREACIECAERWLDGSTVLSVRGYITGERF